MAKHMNIIGTEKYKIMTKNYRFYKEEDGRWYVDIPEWEGSKDDLEMVCGADIMLNIMAQGSDSILLLLSDEPYKFTPMVRRLDGSEVDYDIYSLPDVTEINKIKETPEIGGANYTFTKWCGIEYNLEIWLCGVDGLPS